MGFRGLVCASVYLAFQRCYTRKRVKVRSSSGMRVYLMTRWSASSRTLDGKATPPEIVAKLCERLVMLFQPFFKRFRP